MKDKLKGFLGQHPAWHALARVITGNRVFPIFLDFPVNCKPRYGYARPVHQEINQLLEGRRDSYQALLQQCLNYQDQLAAIPRHTTDSVMPHWHNPMFSGMDAVILYCALAIYRPQRYIEIGSGHSTRFARLSVTTNQLSTQIISIDPRPRAQIAALVDEHIRQPLEETDLSIFTTLEPGDILFVDNSHRLFMNSDTCVVFLEILPRLKPGVIIHFHDITLPFDYPPQWQARYYSEQYMLAVQLLAGWRDTEVLCPCAFISADETLTNVMKPLWSAPNMVGIPCAGYSFWYRQRATMSFHAQQADMERD